MLKAERISRAHAAMRLGVTTRTLRRWEQRGYVPKPVRIGEGPAARCFYNVVDFERCKAVTAKA